jgi:hypothetical protein
MKAASFACIGCLLVGALTQSKERQLYRAMSLPNGVAPPQAEVREVNLCDTRALSKLPTYKGDKASWNIWSFKVLGYVGVVSPGLARHLRSVVTIDEPIIHLDLAPEDVQVDAQLYQLLTLLLEDDALQTLMNVSEGHGMEWWRMVARQHEPQTASARRQKIMAIIKGEGITGPYRVRLAMWEKMIKDFDATAPLR